MMAVRRLPFAIFFSINSTIGIIGNFVMILCFLRNQKLRNPCHVLITLLCFCDLLNLCGELIFSFQVFTNMPTTQETCYFIQMLPIVGASAGSPLILAIGLDRLSAVCLPTWYRNSLLKKRRYVLLSLTFPLVYTAFILISGYETRDQLDSALHMCSLPFGMGDTTFRMFNYVCVVIYALVLSIYSAVYISLRTCSASTHFKKVFKALAVTVAFVLLGWVTGTLINVFNYLVVTDPEYYQMNIMFSGIPVHFSLSSNVFVFYAINPDYRITIKELFGATETKFGSQANSGRVGSI